MPESGQFFFPPLQIRYQAANNGARVRLDCAAIGQEQDEFFCTWHRAGLPYRSGQYLEDFVGQFVRLFRPALVRQQARQALASKRGLSDVEDRSREAERSGRVDDRACPDLHTAQHLVFDLEQVVGIEEGAVAKQGIDDRIGMRMDCARHSQSLKALRAVTRGARTHADFPVMMGNLMS
jgi:hypothetical protein